MDDTSTETQAPARRRSDSTVEVARTWVAAWTGRDLDGVFRLMAAGVTIESNLDPDGDFVEIMSDFAAAVDRVTVVSEIATDGRASLLYDCTPDGGGEPVRVAEFLDIRDGLVTGIRRVYDVIAAERLLRK